MYFIEKGTPVFTRAKIPTSTTFYVPETGWFVSILNRKNNMTHVHFGSASGWVQTVLTPVTFNNISVPYNPTLYKQWGMVYTEHSVLDDLLSIYKHNLVLRGDKVFNRVSAQGFFTIEGQLYTPEAYSAFATRNKTVQTQWVGV